MFSLRNPHYQMGDGGKNDLQEIYCCFGLIYCDIQLMEVVSPQNFLFSKKYPTPLSPLSLPSPPKLFFIEPKELKSGGLALLVLVLIKKQAIFQQLETAKLSFPKNIMALITEFCFKDCY